jgi:hypothetical protein
MGKGASRLAAARSGRRSPVNTGAPWLEPEKAKTRVLLLQRKLHKWATTDKQQRFCDLWNLCCDPAVIQVAWLRVRENKGSRTAGIDGTTRHYVEHHVGVERFLEDIRSSLRSRSFHRRLRHAEEITGNVSRTCRYYWIFGQLFWSQFQHVTGLRSRVRL